MTVNVIEAIGKQLFETLDKYEKPRKEKYYAVDSVRV